MIIRSKIAVLLVLFALLTCAVQADIAKNFPCIGDEKEDGFDEVTGRSFTYLTSGEYMNCHNYPHNRSWLENEQYILMESSRPRPDGTYNAKPGTEDIWFRGERQLLAVNIETGNIYHLATLELEDASKYPGHLPMSSQYHADYAPESNTIVYYDMTGHNLYMLDLNTGKRNKIWTIADGTLGDPPAISTDGTMVLVYTNHSGPETGEFLAGRTTVVYRFDIDGIEAKGKPTVIYTFTQLIANDGQRVAPCHCVINPANKDEWSFCRGFNGLSDDTITKSRVWYGKTDGSLIKNASVTPDKHIFTHEIWGHKGRYIYWVDIVNQGTNKGGGVNRVDPRTGEVEVLFKDLVPWCLHITLDDNEERIAYETQSYTKDNPLDEYNNHLEWLEVFNMKTRKSTRILRFLEGRDHPRQCHPAINGDGTKIAFTTAAGCNSRVAIIEVGKID